MANRFARSPTARTVLGLGLAALAQLLSFLLAGAGHGWVAPLFLSVALWAFIPATLSITWPIGSSSRREFFGILVAALGADALLISRTIDEGNALPFYVEVNGAVGLLIIGLWLALWLFWQALLVYSLVVGRRRADDANA